MLEFSSISVSSYDAASLADKLTDKSADGWSVVSIVAAGTNVTAYLSRERSQAPVEEIGAEAPAAAEEAPVAEPAFEPVLPASAATTAAAEPAVEEPAGWAVEPEPAASPTVAETTTEPAAGTTGWGGGETAAAAAATQAAETPVEDQPSYAAETTAQAEPAQQGTTAQAAASAATAPAGWYADPSGRYELRYWDGTQWTEHVSRAGQQYTDPPVA